MKSCMVAMFTLVLAGTLTSLPAYGQDACTNLQGAYGFSRNGTAGFGTISAAAVGVMVFDGAGNISGHDTTSVNGNIIRRTLSGTYTVNPDCTGSLTITFITGTPGRVSPNDFVIVEGGKGLLLINTNAGEVILGSARKQTSEAWSTEASHGLDSSGSTKSSERVGRSGASVGSRSGSCTRAYGRNERRLEGSNRA